MNEMSIERIILVPHLIVVGCPEKNDIIHVSPHKRTIAIQYLENVSFITICSIASFDSLKATIAP